MIRTPANVLSVVLIMGLYSALQPPVLASQEDTQGASEEIARACALTLTNVWIELQGLAGKFPVLDGISSAKLVNGEPYDKVAQKPLPVYHRLDYRKNVRTIQTAPDAQGRVPASGERHVVENGGMELVICIVDAPVKVAGTVLLLPIGEGKTQMRLVFRLEQNPDVPPVTTAIRDVIEKHVEVLRTSLRTIIEAFPGTLK